MSAGCRNQTIFCPYFLVFSISCSGWYAVRILCLHDASCPLQGVSVYAILPLTRWSSRCNFPLSTLEMRLEFQIKPISNTSGLIPVRIKLLCVSLWSFRQSQNLLEAQETDAYFFMQLMWYLDQWLVDMGTIPWSDCLTQWAGHRKLSGAAPVEGGL